MENNKIVEIEVVDRIFEKLKNLEPGTETSITRLEPELLTTYNDSQLTYIFNEVVVDRCTKENIELDFSRNADQKIGLIYNIPFIKK